MSLTTKKEEAARGYAVVHTAPLDAPPDIMPFVHELQPGESLVLANGNTTERYAYGEEYFDTSGTQTVISVDENGVVSVVIKGTNAMRAGRRTLPKKRIGEFIIDNNTVWVAWGRTQKAARRTAHLKFAGRRRAAHN